MQDLHQLPKLRDSLSYLYAEHCIVEQNAKAIEIFDKTGSTMVPAAALTVLLLGPGTRITHAAVKTLASNGCAIVWVGEDCTRYYANGTGETRRAYHLLHQARLASDERLRLEVCKRMYRKRFGEHELDPGLSIQQLRGMEGARMRTAYAQASIRYGVAWHGRQYDRNHWDSSDPINRALSAANALLNGLCHAAIVSGGYSPALGFIHTGKQRSFVFDIADLYKTEITIPVAFRITGEGTKRLGPRVREACRQAFKDVRLLQRILPDIDHLLAVPDDVLSAGEEADEDPARPEPLWDPDGDDEDWLPPSDEPTQHQDTTELLFQRRVKSQASLGGPARPASAGGDPAPQDLGSEQRTSSWEPAPGETDHAPVNVAVDAPQRSVEDVDREREEALRRRRERAREGLAGGWTVWREAPETWHVITGSGPPGYTVTQVGEELECDCPDYIRNGLGACKHTFAVAMKQDG
ncbi:MAG: type I-E CRISPR-associated endonuclease Cas1e [Anaerolineae bacterium]